MVARRFEDGLSFGDNASAPAIGFGDVDRQRVGFSYAAQDVRREGTGLIHAVSVSARREQMRQPLAVASQKRVERLPRMGSAFGGGRCGGTRRGEGSNAHERRLGEKTELRVRSCAFARSHGQLPQEWSDKDVRFCVNTFYLTTPV